MLVQAVTGVEGLASEPPEDGLLSDEDEPPSDEPLDEEPLSDEPLDEEPLDDGPGPLLPEEL
jgi:hypothetical protein